MPPRIESANAKLTRTLRIVGRRADGYHLLDAEMIALDLADELVFTESDVPSLEVIETVVWEGTTDGAPPTDRSPVPADGSNLVLRALAAADRPAAVRLTKRIPAGAGLGGGSSDAAAALRFAGVRDVGVAVRLGADVPFCLEGGRARVRGVGEVIEPLDDEPLEVLLVTPAFGVSTAAAYAAYDEVGPGDGPNDLERAALIVEPRLARVRDLLREAATREPVLAGSGSTYFVECRTDAAAALRSEVVDALRTGGVVASVVASSSTGRLTSVPPAR